MAVNPGLQEQIRQLEAHIQFVEAQTFMSDSKLAAASADERAMLRQEEQLLQHQLIASREQLAILQQQDRMLQPLEDHPRRAGRVHMLLRCILAASAVMFASTGIEKWQRIWRNRHEAFGVVYGPYLAAALIAISVSATLYHLRPYLFGYHDALEAVAVQIERALIKLGLYRWVL